MFTTISTHDGLLKSVRQSILLTTVLALLTAVTVPVHAQAVSCGATLSASGNYTLTTDLVCAAGDGVKITASGVHLNLAGFTIDGGGDPLSGNNSRCTDASAGINVGPNVSDVHINNGTVRGFTFGIQMNGSTRSQLNGITAIRNCFYGVQLNNSDNNALEANTVVENGSTLVLPGGFFCGGVNTLCGGISLQGSHGNDINSEDVRRNAQLGVAMDANSSGNTIRSSDASQTGVLFGFNAVGIEDLGNSNTIRSSTSNGNTSGGIQIRGPNDIVMGNTANGNGPGGGHCANGSGICVVLGPGMNVIQDNTALGNTGVDLGDENPGCDADTWKSNTFGTSNQACIK
jgi:parallel beta-helix repeat protein